MRIAKVPCEVVYQKVWASLCARMDPKTHLVRPSWLTMMREIHVCRQRIADAVRMLRDQGKIKSVDIPRQNGDGIDIFYEIVDKGVG